MTLIIISLVICMFVGSALWILPSPREKRQMLLRRQAMSKGIQVQLSQLKNPKNPIEKVHCVAYRLPLDAKRPANTSWLLYQPEMSHRSHISGWSFGAHGIQPDEHLVQQLTPMLENLPGDTLAIERTPVSVGLYWKERGEAQDVELIHQALIALQSM